MIKIKTTFDKVNEGLNLIKRQGGDVYSKDTAGSVSISGVEARYSFDIGTEILTVAIDDKPWLASDSMIEDKIREFFN